MFYAAVVVTFISYPYMSMMHLCLQSVGQVSLPTPPSAIATIASISSLKTFIIFTNHH